MAYDYDLFVIGGGSGGVRCARIAAGHGARVGIAEDTHWGGTCVNVGCVPKKIMVQAAEYGRLAQDSHGFGWDTHPPRHDWAALMRRKDAEVGRLNDIYRKMLDTSGVTRHDAHARFTDPHTLELRTQDGTTTTVTAERIVIAVGGTPSRQGHIQGHELAIDSDQAFFLPDLPRRILMIGGGYIGVEFAGLFRGMGAEVDVVFRQPLPLRGFDEDLREALATAMTAHGIRLHPKQTVHKIEAVGDARRVTLSGGHVLEVDLVFAAVGRDPRTPGLGLDAAGVATDKTGAVVVDGANRTNQPHIYALGDVSNSMNLTPVAIAEGHHLADTLFAPPPARTWSFNPVATAVFYSTPMATVGLTEAEAIRHGPADIYMASFTPMRHTISGRPGKTLMKMIVDQASQRVVGVHILGDDAPEMMQGIGVALTAGATKADFDRTIGVHPTSAEEFVTLRTRTRVAGTTAQAA